MRLTTSMISRSATAKSPSPALKRDWEQTFTSVPDLDCHPVDGAPPCVRANRRWPHLGCTPPQCVDCPCYKASTTELDAPPAFAHTSRPGGRSRTTPRKFMRTGLGGDFLVSTTPMFGPGRQDDTAHPHAREHLRTQTSGGSVAEESEETPAPASMPSWRKRVKERTAELVAANLSLQAEITEAREGGGIPAPSQSCVDDVEPMQPGSLSGSDDENRSCRRCARSCSGRWISHGVGRVLPKQDEDKSVGAVAECGFEEGYLEQARISWEINERGRGPTVRPSGRESPDQPDSSR